MALTTFSVAVKRAKLLAVRSLVWIVPSLICAEVIWVAAYADPAATSATTAPPAATAPTLLCTMWRILMSLPCRGSSVMALARARFPEARRATPTCHSVGRAASVTVQRCRTRPTSTTLAARAAAGDAAALDELLAEIQPRVRRICGRMLLYPEDAEEAAQDALLLVATKIGGFEGRSRFTTWLHAVASNSARATYRSLKRRSAERAHRRAARCTWTRGRPA